MSRSTHAVLRELAAERDLTMAQLVDEAIRAYRDKQFWEEYDAAYAALKADPAAWAEYQDEITAWDATLADGLEVPPDERNKGRGRPRAR